jgi:LysM repeat protein
MAAKTPKKFRQARKAARVDAKKVFSGKTQARLKDKTNPLGKFSADDKEALNDVTKEAKGKYITDDKGNKIKTTNITPKEAAAEYKRTTQASNEAFRSKMRAEFGEYAGKKATQADYDANPKMKERAPKAAPGKPAPRFTESGKVRSAVTATEVKPQGKVLKKKPAKGIGGTAGTVAKPKPGLADQIKKDVAKVNANKAKVNKPATKGFAAGKQLNTEGKAIYDKLIKEGVKPKSALNKALFRQEKGAKVAAKAAAPIATAAKSAAEKVKSRVPAGAKPIGTGTMKNGKITFKFDDKQIKSVAEKNRANKAIKVPSTVVSSKPNVPGKELAVRPSAGPLVAKTAAKKGGAKAALKAAALGAAKSTGKLLTGKAALAVTAASLLGEPVLKALTKEPAGAKVRRFNAATTTGPKSRSNQPRITGQGKLIGKGNIPTMSAGGATSTYRVNAGDTLSGIAKKSGVSLSELMAANKKIKDPRKIYRNTAINIPSKGKVPTGGYAGPVPYRPKKK